jgi:hypothetical protein
MIIFNTEEKEDQDQKQKETIPDWYHEGDY